MAPAAVSKVSVDDGAAAVELGLLLGLIAAAILVSVSAVGTSVSETFESACTSIAGGRAHAPTPAGGGGGLATAPGLNRRGC